MDTSDVSRRLREAAARNPDRRAVVLESGKSITYGQLNAECDRFAAYFAVHGVQAGARVAVFVKPGFSFVPTIFGLFRLGAVAVCIDPGMRLKHLLACVREAAPTAVIGIRRALWVAKLFPRAFADARLRLSVPSIVPGVIPTVPFTARPSQPTDTAAILFTSGSTGIPKGVVYTHGAFDDQRRTLRETYGIADGEIELVVFPLFALFSAAWGNTAVVPAFNPACPARANGKALARLISKQGVTHGSGSPAVWKNLADYCHRRGRKLPTLRRILMAGAQVPEKLVRSCAALGAEVHTPYGATEALPLTTISHRELFASYEQTRRGAGTCVGLPLPDVDIAILPFIDGPIDRWDETLRLPPGIRGEVAVRAPWVTREYFARPDATSRAKIPSSRGTWHRMGDCGYLDDKGRLWFCGRKDHRIFTPTEQVCPDPWEAVFDSFPGVSRCAVVGVGRPGSQKPVIVVEGRRRGDRFQQGLLALTKTLEGAPEIEDVVFRKRFPVDVRHNIKIDRPLLARRIEGQFPCDP